MKTRFPRRDFIKLAASAAAVGPFFNFSHRVLGNPKTLKIAKWDHFVPEYDAWFETEWAKPWGEKNNTNVIIDSIPVEKVHAEALAEVAAGKGHDLFMFPWPPAEFQQHAIDHTEIYQNISMNYGSIPQISNRSTFDPRTKTHFAMADFWVPSPVHYYQDFWAEVGMPVGPVTYDGLYAGGKRAREKLGLPCGLSFSPTLEGNITANTLLYALRGQILDANGNAAINRNLFAAHALNYVKNFNQDAGTPEEFTWGPSGNVQDMLARKTICTTNAISLLRAAEKQNPELAKRIKLQPPLLGTYGVTGFPQATNCSTVWKFAENPDGAKQFLVDLIDSSRTGFDKSLSCNFPTYPKALPNIVVRLYKDPKADPPHKYYTLRDALHWTPNLGSPGFANSIWMEVFNTFVIPRMFASVAQGKVSPQDAAAEAQKEVTVIVEKWKQTEPSAARG
ncbi:MAG TPA: ABC transporter substrate-binding protein [Candidatus Acidoferrales bacterium]|nr:ABC transporter substrate-binding protein [Candidatus Acidoferrales bacterium]